MLLSSVPPEMAGYLGNASGKTRRGMEGGDVQQRNCSAGGSWSCGWWERWGKALLVHKLPLAGTKLPWPKWGGGNLGRRGAGGSATKWWMDSDKPGGTLAVVGGVRSDLGWWEGVRFGLRICVKRLENIL